MNLDELVSRVRRERAMSLSQVAAAGNISRQSVWEMEHDMSRNITVTTITGLSKALKLKPEMILAAAIASLSTPKEPTHVPS